MQDVGARATPDRDANVLAIRSFPFPQNIRTAASLFVIAQFVYGST